MQVKPFLKILSVLMKRQAVFCNKISTWDDIYFRLAIIKVVGNWTSMMIKLTCNDLHDLQQLPQNELFSYIMAKKIISIFLLKGLILKTVFFDEIWGFKDFWLLLMVKFAITEKEGYVPTGWLKSTFTMFEFSTLNLNIKQRHKTLCSP